MKVNNVGVLSTNTNCKKNNPSQIKNTGCEHANNNVSVPFNNNYVLAFLGKKDYTENEKQYFEYKKQLSKKFHGLDKAESTTCWDFYINSTDENMTKYSQAYDECLKLGTSKEVFEKLKSFNEKGVTDPNLKKSLDKLIKDYTVSVAHADEIKALQKKEDAIAQTFNKCRGEIDGKPYSNAQLGKMLDNEKDVELRKKVYHERRVKAPDLIANDLIDLVKMRNEYAQKNGYKDFFSYKMAEGYKISEEKLSQLLDDLDAKTKDVANEMLTKSHKKLADAYGIEPHELRPYHHGLLLEGNPIKEADKYVLNNDMITDTASNMYKRMGMDIEKLPIFLDIFPKEGKNQHGFCFDIDTNKDVRILANLRNDLNSIETLNHELGHAAYDLGISEHLPLFQRGFASSAMTEAVAMLMESVPYREGSLVKDLGIPKELSDQLEEKRCKDLVQFVRNYLSHINFEKQMYANPDQNIPKLWYEMQHKFMNRNIPEVLDNHWASVPHFLSHPAYLQNYLRAEIMAAQIYEAAHEKLGNLSENTNTAEFFRKKLFRVGASLTEDEVIKKVTGKELNVEAFCKQFKNLRF